MALDVHSFLLMPPYSLTIIQEVSHILCTDPPIFISGLNYQ